MSSIERFSRKIEENKAKKEYEEKLKAEAVPPSLLEIFQDPQLSELLTLSLKADGKLELAQKIIERKTLDPKDFETLDAYRKIVKEAEEASKEILNNLTPERIERIASASEEFRRLVGILGVEGVIKFLGVYLARLYVIDPTKFGDLENKITKIREAEEKLQQIDNELKKACEKYGITPEELEELYEQLEKLRTQGADEKQIEEEIKAFVKKKLGRLKGLLDFREKLSKEGIEALKKIEEIDKILTEINTNLTEILEPIAVVFFAESEEYQDPKYLEYKRILSEALTEALYTGVIEEPGAMSFREARFSEEELNRAWEEFLTKKGVTNWNELGPEARDSYKQDFLPWFGERFMNRRRLKKGSVIMDILIGMVDRWIQTK